MTSSSSWDCGNACIIRILNVPISIRLNKMLVQMRTHFLSKSGMIDCTESASYPNLVDMEAAPFTNKYYFVNDISIEGVFGFNFL